MYASFERHFASGPGFRTDHLLLMGFDPGLSGYDATQAQRFYEQLIDEAGQAPGVESVGAASFVPLSASSRAVASIRPEGYAFPQGVESASVSASYVDADFFGAMAIPVIEGRAFNRNDRAEAPRVAIVNQQLAERYWPGQNALGRRFRLYDSEGPWVEIVGVVPTSKYFSISEPAQEFLYLPYAQNPVGRMTLLVQSAGEPAALAEPLREVVRGVDAGMVAVSVRTMQDFYYDYALGSLLVIIRAVAAIGVMGVTLAFVGLYGLASYMVSRRTREIGIRMAVGADQGAILRMVLRSGLSLAAIGLALGLILTFGADRAMQATFPGGSGGHRGVAEYVLAVIVVFAVTSLAAYLPARRAARIKPTRALRCD